MVFEVFLLFIVNKYRNLFKICAVKQNLVKNKENYIFQCFKSAHPIIYKLIVILIAFNLYTINCSLKKKITTR